MTRATGKIFFRISPTATCAQNISRAEYSFNSDTVVGNGIPATVPIPAEAATFLLLLARPDKLLRRLFQHLNKKLSLEWSLNEPGFFDRVGLGPGEYFIDMDPRAATFSASFFGQG